MNGIKNIFAGNIFFNDTKNNSEHNIDHVVAFITDKKDKINGEFYFKNKDAIIIDPWLGIVDYASNYFKKLQTQFRGFFKNIPETDSYNRFINPNSLTPEEYRQYMAYSKARYVFKILPFPDSATKNETLERYKKNFPELLTNKK